jgi:hypothetical protein
LNAIVEDIVIDEHRVVVKITPAFKAYFTQDFWFSCDVLDLKKIPESHLLVPFILNIAPVVWACGLNVTVPFMDAKLLTSLLSVKAQFKTMYPALSWSGNIDCAKIVHSTEAKTDKNRVALLFSGGVDSINLSQECLQKQQILLTIRGADVKLDDDQGWQEVKAFVHRYASQINATTLTIESNFATFINYQLLSKQFFSIPEWWGMVQHGIGLAGFLLISASAYQPSQLLMASDCSAMQMKDLSWGSVSSIMQNLKLPPYEFTHTSYELARQEKITNLASNYRAYGQVIPVRVCYTTRGGKNCGVCRKCLLAMLGFAVSGVDYQPFGFPTAHGDFIKIVKKKLFTTKHHVTGVSKVLWLNLYSHIMPREYYKSLGLPLELIDAVMWLKAVDIEAVSKRSQRYFFIRRILSYWSRQLPFSKTVYNFLR